MSQATRIFVDKPLNAFMGAGGLGTGISDFDGKEGVDAYPGVMRGGNIRLMSTGDGPIAGFGATPPGVVESDWGAEFKKAALEWHDRAATITTEAEHLAYRQNHLDLDPTYTDKYGDPLARMTLDWTDHERAQGAMLSGVHAKIAKAMNARAAAPNSRQLERYTVTQYQSTHVNGGAIMGTSPDRSVVNPWLQHWQVPNLWVAGASAFPQNGSGKSDVDDSRDYVARGGCAGGPISEEAGEARMTEGVVRKDVSSSSCLAAESWRRAAVRAGRRAGSPGGAGQIRRDQSSTPILLPLAKPASFKRRRNAFSPAMPMDPVRRRPEW